jgi:hypothetical protein
MRKSAQQRSNNGSRPSTSDHDLGNPAVKEIRPATRRTRPTPETLDSSSHVTENASYIPNEE